MRVTVIVFFFEKGVRNGWNEDAVFEMRQLCYHTGVTGHKHRFNRMTLVLNAG